MTTTTSSTSSRNPSTMQRRSRLGWPGTLTRAELLGSQSRPLRRSSPLTPMMFPSSSLPSSSSQNDSRLRKRRKLTATPNAPTAADSDTPMPDAPRSTPPAPTVRFIILVQLTDARTPPAQREATTGSSQTAVPPPLPTAPIAGTTIMPSQSNAGLDHYPLLNPRPPHILMKNYPTPPLTVRKPWMWATMANKHPLLPKPLQLRLLIFPPPDPPATLGTTPPPPSGPQPAPTGQGLPSVSPSNPRVRPGND